MDRARHSFIRFAWITLGATVAVILWGAVVRATGSGAGCGSHWPFCNGVVLPLAPATATIIEFTHRLTSGAAMILAVVLALWARRVFPAGHRARAWALWSLIFMLVEAAIGAGIVLLGLVEGNASALRAGYIAVHLTNTMFLMGAMTGTIRMGTAGTKERTPRTKSTSGTARVLALALMIVVAAAGAVVALGDTLFPHASLAEGIAADLDPTSHFLIRLRLWHPVLAVGTAILAVVSFRSTLVTTLVIAQAGLGVMNVLMLAPLPLQMAHLLGSSVLWIAMVWKWLGTDAEMT
ncbi:MAG TPA: COX15/CtaA family protein [Vicinamibacterales bacterium]|nr:COX15/CtaA family protein [Vicinamibacterales bacterium]